METIKNYVTSDIGASQSLVTLELFIGDVDNAELADDSTFDTGDAVTAINGLIFSLERRDAEIERLRSALNEVANPLKYMEERAKAEGMELNAAAPGICDNVSFVKQIARDALRAT